MTNDQIPHLPLAGQDTREPGDLHDRVEEPWQTLDLRPDQRTVRTYTVGAPLNQSHPFRMPEPAYVVREDPATHDFREICHHSALLAVAELPGSPAFTRNSPSAASSGLSVNEVKTPQRVRLSALLQPPGVYGLWAEHPSSQWSGDSADTLADEKSAVHFTIKSTGDLSDKIATQASLQTLTDRHPLPDIAGNPRQAQARYLGLTLYRRLMILVLLANIVAITTLGGLNATKVSSFTYRKAGIGCGANLVVGVLARQEHVINTLFRLACALPHSSPLQLRRNAAKLAYNNGGVHSGCGNSALLWYIAYTVLLVRQFRGTPGQERAIAATAASILVLFATIIGMAHPSLRRKYHDYWELSHRYCGYAAIGIIWAQTVILAVAVAHNSKLTTGLTLVQNPVFWFLVIITLCLIYPWLWLRRLPVEANQLSTHATELRFYNRRVADCVGTRLSHSPLVENHGFATISHGKGVKGYSVIVSNAGDFTKELILHPPTHIWQRGAPTTGVMRVASMFTPIVVVATGSGIGPCLSFLNRNRAHKMRIIWSARFPEATYQRAILANVLEADPDAIIIDTKKTGHPNLAALTYALYKDIDAEAIAIISNPKVTRDVVYEMEARKVPAFGAIFDS